MVNTKKNSRVEYLDQVISLKSFDGNNLERASWSRPQAPSLKHQANRTLSCKPQAPSSKLQAPSRKRQAP